VVWGAPGDQAPPLPALCLREVLRPLRGLGVGSTLILTFERSLPSEHPLRGGPGPLVPVASLLLIRGLLRLRRSLPLEPSCGTRPLDFRGPGSAGP